MLAHNLEVYLAACDSGDEATLHSLMSMPRPTQRALAAAAAHLSSFSLEAVLPSAAEKSAKHSSDGEQTVSNRRFELHFEAALILMCISDYEISGNMHRMLWV